MNDPTIDEMMVPGMWTSCSSQPSGSHRRGIHWPHQSHWILEGVLPWTGDEPSILQRADGVAPGKQVPKSPIGWDPGRIPLPPQGGETAQTVVTASHQRQHHFLSEDAQPTHGNK